jgi:hypothetical protein
MVGHIIAALRQSPLVQDLEIIEAIEEASAQLLRVRAEIIDGSPLYVREAFFPPCERILLPLADPHGRAAAALG